MKVFIWVLIGAAILGGLIGGEILESGFSITGAVVGGVGTGAILLGLGGYFSAQESKKSPELTPEMRGVFDRMITGKDNPTRQEVAAAKKTYLNNRQPQRNAQPRPQRWTPRPFYKNETPEEKREWFANVPMWNKVNPQLLEEISEKFGSNPLFEVFVITSMETGLVDEYVKLGHRGYVPGIGCTQVAGVLCKEGIASVNKMTQLMQAPRIDKGKIVPLCSEIINTLEPAIALDENQILAYLGLAHMKAMLDRRQEAIDMAKQGLNKVIELKDKKTPFHMSQLPEVRSMAEQLDEMEQTFQKIISDMQ